MKSPLFKFPRAAQPPKVVLLPDSHFFVRVVPIAPGSSAAEAASQAELAVESLSPFPATQLFYGFYWLPGADDAVIYAAYRRRFTPEQTATWNDAQLVIPAFVAALGLPTIDGSTLVLDTVEGFTAIRWAASPIPAAVAHRPAPRELDEVIRASERRALLAAVSAGGVINDIATDPVVVEGNPDDGVVFRVAEATARLDAAQASRADVRDKAALAEISRRNARARLLWRGFVGTAAALVVLAVGELALIGGSVWQRSREAQLNAQRPVVQRIETAQNLSNRIHELSTKRLLPLEMLSAVSAGKPDAITFLRATTNGLYSLVIDAQSTAPDAVSAFQASLGSREGFERVEIRDQRTRENVMAFTMAVTFRPEALKPATAP